MKKDVLFIFLGALSLFAKAGKIDFIDNDWSKARAEAAKQHKYLLVDAYTDWCSWCKVMDKQTFPDPDVVAFVNSNFVAAKMEMQHGYGLNLSMKFMVNAFPSYLVFSPEGKLVYRIMGYMPAKDFIAKLKEAIDPAKQSAFPGVSDKIDLDFPDFLKASFDPKGSPAAADSLTILHYLDGQTDLMNEVNRCIIERFFSKLSPKYRSFFLENHNKYTALYGKDEVELIINQVAYDKLTQAIYEKSEAEKNAAIDYAKKNNPDFDNGGIQYFTLTYYKGVGEWKKFAATIDDMISKHKDIDANTINDWCWTVYEKADDPEVVKRAIAWMQPVIGPNTEYAIMDTYAALLYKGKKTDDAEKYAQLAIATGKKSGENTKTTEALLVKIQEEKKQRAH